jgi:hypothetical protein
LSWYQLLEIREQAREEWRLTPGNGVIPPVACPDCGEPLKAGPQGAGSVILFCPYDGWQYPRDWSKPVEPLDLFGGQRGVTGPIPQ